LAQACCLKPPYVLQALRQVGLLPRVPHMEDVSDETMTVLDLAGDTVVTLGPPPPSTLAELQVAIEEHCGIRRDFVTIVQEGELVTDSEDASRIDYSLPVTLIVDDAAQFLWDSFQNPDIAMLDIDEGHVRCPKLTTDYVNVVTQAPLGPGSHFLEFVMHEKQDEQWCGVVPSKALGWGRRVSGHSRRMEGALYYCGREAARGCLQIDGVKSEPWKSVGSGDVIGMVVDVDARSVAFSCNGEVQGACRTPAGPLYLLTHVDDPLDYVELRRRLIEDAPSDLLEAARIVHTGEDMETVDAPPHLIEAVSTSDEGSWCTYA